MRRLGWLTYLISCAVVGWLLASVVGSSSASPLVRTVVNGFTVFVFLGVAFFARALKPRTILAVAVFFAAQSVLLWSAAPLQSNSGGTGFFLADGARIVIYAGFMYAVLGPWKTRLDRLVGPAAFGVSFLGYVFEWALVYEDAQRSWRECLAPALAHHVDSLYFALTTLATVGFGDFHPSTPNCRWLVSTQIAADLSIIAVAVAGLISQLTTRAPARSSTENDGRGEGPPPETA